MHDIFISYFHQDRPHAEALASAFTRVGLTVWWDRTIQPGQTFDRVIEDALNGAMVVMVLWSRASVESRWVLNEAEEAAARNILVPVLIEADVRIPLAFKRLQAVNLVDWNGSLKAPSFRELIERVSERIGQPGLPETVLPQMAPPAPAPQRSKRTGLLIRMRRISTEIADVATGVVTGVAVSARSLIDKVRSWSPNESPESKVPVRLGISAPQEAVPRATFTARFVAYVANREDAVSQRLRDLDRDIRTPIVGLPPERDARWMVGTPVTVRLGGDHLRGVPPERSFKWNGAENLLSFVVLVEPSAPIGVTQLCFEVFIEGVSVAFIPVSISIVAVDRERPDSAPVTVTARPLTSAFASYASQDAALVALLLSALKRWDSGADVFMDCLDLTPNERWQHELERVIPSKDAFLLFWSANASKSRWVAWELKKAQEAKGIAWIRPMPIDDPDIAPPPEVLRHLQFRDKYLLTRQAFLRLGERR